MNLLFQDSLKFLPLCSSSCLQVSVSILSLRKSGFSLILLRFFTFIRAFQSEEQPLIRKRHHYDVMRCSHSTNANVSSITSSIHNHFNYVLCLDSSKNLRMSTSSQHTVHLTRNPLSLDIVVKAPLVWTEHNRDRKVSMSQIYYSVIWKHEVFAEWCLNLQTKYRNFLPHLSINWIWDSVYTIVSNTNLTFLAFLHKADNRTLKFQKKIKLHLLGIKITPLTIIGLEF